jgi:flagellar basal-body rod modification protein FlgD
MSTEAVSGSGLRTLEEYQKQSQNTGSSALDMDSFLKLFVAQLASQDPLSGSSGGSGGTDYISQLAQLTMLEQFTALNSALSSSQVYSMIGKYVYIGDGTKDGTVQGIVDGVVTEGDEQYLLVGGKYYSMSDVFLVVDPDAVSGATQDQILQSANLIGKTVTAVVTKDGEETTITGKVEEIVVEDGVIYLVIDGENVALGNITGISPEDADE